MVIIDRRRAVHRWHCCAGCCRTLPAAPPSPAPRLRARRPVPLIQPGRRHLDAQRPMTVSTCRDHHARTGRDRLSTSRSCARTRRRRRGQRHRRIHRHPGRLLPGRRRTHTIPSSRSAATAACSRHRGRGMSPATPRRLPAAAAGRHRCPRRRRGRSCLYIGDIGDNKAVAATTSRSSGSASPTCPTPPTEPVPADKWRYTYPDGAQDAEAIMVDPDGSVIIVTKPDGASRRPGCTGPTRAAES